jgi:hypothetical protein
MTMTVAEIRGKISETGISLSERMEDLLTSDIFGCTRYLSAQKVLIPFLQTARSFHGKSLTVPRKVVKVYYSFWPWLKLPGRIPCEPDVALGLETEDHHVHLVIVESKYYSGLSSKEDERIEPNDQLARELDNLDGVSRETLGWRPHLGIASRALLFVTQDMGMPRELLRQSLAEYEQKRKREGDIFWASWRFLPSILEQSLQNETNSEYVAVMEDMLMLLLRKELIMFPGIEPITGSFNIADFYYVTPAIYKWPVIRKSMRLGYGYEVLK